MNAKVSITKKTPVVEEKVFTFEEMSVRPGIYRFTDRSCYQGCRVVIGQPSVLNDRAQMKLFIAPFAGDTVQNLNPKRWIGYQFVEVLDENVSIVF